MRHYCQITDSFTLFLTENSTLECVGRFNSEEENIKPFSISIPAHLSQIISISCGTDFTIGLTEIGEVISFGKNKYGQLGRTIKDVGDKWYRPKKIEIPGVDTQYVSDISCGNQHTLFIINKNLWSCGKNDFGQLCRATPDDSCSIPTKTELFDICNVFGGYNCSFIKFGDGQIFCCGENDLGQLGIDPPDHHIEIPTALNFNRVEPTSNVIFISCGKNHCLFLFDNGKVYSAGCNNDGKLGVGLDKTPNTINLVKISTFVTKISCGEDFNMCLDSDGILWTFGNGFFGQLGHGDGNHKSLPHKVKWFKKNKATIINFSRGFGSHAVVQDSDGSLYSFGKNEDGQLNCKNKYDQLLPVPLIEKYSYLFGGRDKTKQSPKKSARK